MSKAQMNVSLSKEASRFIREMEKTTALQLEKIEELEKRVETLEELLDDLDQTTAEFIRLVQNKVDLYSDEEAIEKEDAAEKLLEEIDDVFKFFAQLMKNPTGK